MIEGEVDHHDSLGNHQRIRPGQVNLMSAGHGISHAEVSPMDRPGRVHAAQLWIALPDGERNRPPSFHHYPDLPRVEQGGFLFTVLVGEALGQTAEAEVFSPLMGVDARSESAAGTTMSLNPDFEHAAMCLQGEADVGGQHIIPGELLYLGTGRNELEISSDAAARILIIGGEPFGEDILLWWNFVARTQEELAAATEDWNAGRRFGQVTGTDLPHLVAPDLAGLRLRRPGG